MPGKPGHRLAWTAEADAVITRMWGQAVDLAEIVIQLREVGIDTTISAVTRRASLKLCLPERARARFGYAQNRSKAQIRMTMKKSAATRKANKMVDDGQGKRRRVTGLMFDEFDARWVEPIADRLRRR